MKIILYGNDQIQKSFKMFSCNLKKKTGHPFVSVYFIITPTFKFIPSGYLHTFKHLHFQWAFQD